MAGWHGWVGGVSEVASCVAPLGSCPMEACRDPLDTESNEYLNLPDEAAYQARGCSSTCSLDCRLQPCTAGCPGLLHRCVWRAAATPAEQLRRVSSPAFPFPQELGRTICMLGASAAPLLEERFYAGGDAAVLALAALTQTVCSEASVKQAAVDAFWNSTSVWNVTNTMRWVAGQGRVAGGSSGARQGRRALSAAAAGVGRAGVCCRRQQQG